MNTTIKWRELDVGDYLDMVNLLSHLTVVKPLSRDAFEKRCTSFVVNGTHVLVGEINGKLVATGTLHTLPKLVHQGGKVGLIEDVVVHPSYRGRGLGKDVIEILMETAEEKNCYKVMLNCSIDNVGFYEKCNLSRKEVQMVKYF